MRNTQVDEIPAGLQTRPWKQSTPTICGLIDKIVREQPPGLETVVGPDGTTKAWFLGELPSVRPTKVWLDLAERRLFFSSPDGTRYMSELVRPTGAQTRGVIREGLKKLLAPTD